MTNQKIPKIWKIVLTGGPCGGKTTGQARLSSFFENLGWKVYRVPETANVLLSGGIKFADLSPQAAEEFQANLLKTMMQIEKSFFDLAAESSRNCLVICDRGAMDASAYIAKDQWERILEATGLDEVEIRDNRYDQVIHMVSAAMGAEQFYTLENSNCRSEDVGRARELDTRAGEAWVGHPYLEVVDNSATNFDAKIHSLIYKVSCKTGIDVAMDKSDQATKIKFVVNGPLPSDDVFPKFRDFEVVQDYLLTSSGKVQSRLRKRGRKGKWSYTHTVRKLVSGQVIEVKTPLNHRDYSTLLAQRDAHHYSVHTTRRCFMWENQYFQMDIYRKPCHGRCVGLMLLESYTTLKGQRLTANMPTFLKLGKEVTGDSAFSMFNLSLKEDWVEGVRFCHKLTEEEVDTGTNDQKESRKEASQRLEAKTSRQEESQER